MLQCTYSSIVAPQPPRPTLEIRCILQHVMINIFGCICAYLHGVHHLENWQDDLQRAIPRGDFRALGLHGRGIPGAVI